MCSVSEMSWFVGFVCRVLGDALVGEEGWAGAEMVGVGRIVGGKEASNA